MCDISMSNGVSGSEGVIDSKGVSDSEGVNLSDGVNLSRGVNLSNGVNWSFGVVNSSGVDCEIFCLNKKRVHRIFGVEVTLDRFEEVWDELHKRLDGWFPMFHNLVDPLPAWKDMPQDAIDYLKSLREFDRDVFKGVTGIDVDKEEDDDMVDIDGMKWSKQTLRQLIEDSIK